MSFTNAYLIASDFGGSTHLALVRSGDMRGAIKKYLFHNHVESLNCECRKIMKKDHVNVYEIFAKQPFHLLVKKINVNHEYISIDML